MLRRDLFTEIISWDCVSGVNMFVPDVKAPHPSRGRDSRWCVVIWISCRRILKSFSRVGFTVKHNEPQRLCWLTSKICSEENESSVLSENRKETPRNKHDTNIRVIFQIWSSVNRARCLAEGLCQLSRASTTKRMTSEIGISVCRHIKSGSQTWLQWSE